jgi:PKD repeat protein
LNSDGTLKWFYATGNYIYGSAVIGSDGTIYVGSYDKNLYALNSDGSLKWSYTTGGDIQGAPSIGVDGTIYMGDSNGNFYALNSDGMLKWSYTTGGSIKGSAAIGADGTIYVGSLDKKVYAFNPNGTLKWSYTTKGGIYSSPTIGSNGALYIASYDMKIYAFINPAPIASFTTDITGGGVPINVNFTDKSLYATSWEWDFDNDGIVDSTDQNPSYTYTKAGNYTISLTVYNYSGNSITTKSIVLYNLEPVVDFTADVTSGKSPSSLVVNFTDQSLYATSWAWDLDGDGTVDSTEQNPTYTYTTPGYYTVDLTVTGPGGSKTTTKRDYISILPTVNVNITGGTYTATRTVTLTSDDPTATIYYTIDNTDPRNSSTRIQYTVSITINNTTTLRYAAVDIYGNWSVLYLQNYLIGTGTVSSGQSDYKGPETNTNYWTYTTGGNINYATPVIGADGAIYIGSYDGKLYALNSDGTLKWAYTTGGYIYGSPVIGADGAIYIGSYDGKLYALNSDGTLKWAYTTGGEIYG